MPELREILKAAVVRLTPVSDSAKLDAQLLLAEVLNESRAHVLAHPEKILTPEQVATYEGLVARRATGEPIAYMLGERTFYDIDLYVTPDVLIPRPETEHLLEMALEFAEARLKDASGAFTAVDVGTGSGALAVVLKRRLPQVTTYAVDKSTAALDVARRNATRYAVDITFFQGDLLAPLLEHGLKVDLLMANLPYIAHDDMLTLKVSQHEPHLALDGGADGLNLIRRLLQADQAPLVCKPGAMILLEIGADQGAAVRNLAQGAFNGAAVDVRQDYAGHDRVVCIKL